MTQKEEKIFYRYSFVQYAAHDEDNELVSPMFPNPTVQLTEYVLKQETDKGYWIGFKGIDTWRKWIPKISRKRFAYPTKEQALLNLKMRTMKRIRILQQQIEFSKCGLSKINDL
jgi:hypothetical protein